MIVIGITGGLGTGKSTVAKMFKSLGARVLDADEIARCALKRGGGAYKKVVALFGKGILAAAPAYRQAGIDRKKVASIVFKDKRKLDRLNKIVHPIVIEDIKKRLSSIKKKDPEAVVVVDAPLLIESKFYRFVDKLIVVVAAADEQIRRSVNRLKISRDEAHARIKSQLPLKEKTKLADYVIDNSGTLDNTQRQVRAIWEEIKDVTRVP